MLGFLDDDTLPALDWVATVRRILKAGHPAATVGRIREIDKSDLGRLRDIAYEWRHKENLREQMTAQISAKYRLLDLACQCHLVDYLSGGNCCMRADVFADCKGFDPTFKVGQDREFGLRLLSSGYHISYEPGLVIKHRTKSSLPRMISGRYQSGRSAALISAQSRNSIARPAMRASGVRADYGGSLTDIIRTAGLRVGLLAVLSTTAYRFGQASVAMVRKSS
jgi:GT2 family glycosyltransferase